MNNIPNPEKAILEPWPEHPTAEDITRITDLYESECVLEGKEPFSEVHPLTITRFLLDNDIGGEAFTIYMNSIVEELEKRYPLGQMELPM